MVKPDERTPLTLLEFARIAQECGLPPGVLNVVPGEGPVVGARLASHPDVRKIAFTGSTAVGRDIMRMAAGNVKRLTLELGGKGPNIVLDDADLDLAADGTLFGCLMNQGQACESGTRIIVAAARLPGPPWCSLCERGPGRPAAGSSHPAVSTGRQVRPAAAAPSRRPA